MGHAHTAAELCDLIWWAKGAGGERYQFWSNTRASCHGNWHRGKNSSSSSSSSGSTAVQRRLQDAHTLTGGHADTDQRCPAGASAERLVKGRAAELQLLQVAVGNPDVSRQRQALVQVLKPTQQGGKFKTFSAEAVHDLMCHKWMLLRRAVPVKMASVQTSRPFLIWPHYDLNPHTTE